MYRQNYVVCTNRIMYIQNYVKTELCTEQVVRQNCVHSEVGPLYLRQRLILFSTDAEILRFLKST